MAVKQDCPTGLARCVAGAVEVSAGRTSCPTCPCAWTRVVVCDQGCALEDVELVREPDEAKTLCKGSPAVDVLRGSAATATLPPLDAGATSLTCPDQGDRFWCHQKAVYACPERSSAVEVAICTHGCAAEDETLAEPSVDIATATTVMCRHDFGVTHP